MRVSRLLVAAALTVSVGTLAGCEQPDPAVSAFSGTQSVRASALCWSGSSGGLASGQCAQDIISGDQIGNAPSLSVRAGNVVGISVDTAVAEKGWVPAIGGQRLVDAPIKETYFRFTFPSATLPDTGVGLQVLAGSGSQLNGVWAIRLVN